MSSDEGRIICGYTAAYLTRLLQGVRWLLEDLDVAVSEGDKIKQKELLTELRDISIPRLEVIFKYIKNVCPDLNRQLFKSEIEDEIKLLMDTVLRQKDYKFGSREIGRILGELPRSLKKE